MQKKLLKKHKRMLSRLKEEKIIKIIKHLRKNNINVMGHLGILPQSHKGKFRYKGKTISEKKNLLEDAYLLKKVVCFRLY